MQWSGALRSPLAKQSHAVKGNVLRRMASTPPYLFIFAFLAKKGADRLKRDLNSHPGRPARESPCKAGQITAPFLFSFPIVFNRTGIGCPFLPVGRQKKGPGCLLRGWKVCSSLRDWTETYWRLVGLTTQEVTTCMTLWPPWEATEHRVAPSDMTDCILVQHWATQPPPTSPHTGQCSGLRGFISLLTDLERNVESKLSKKV